MTKEQAEAAIFDAFRGMRVRLEKQGLLDLIVERMAPLLINSVDDAVNEFCLCIEEVSCEEE